MVTEKTGDYSITWNYDDIMWQWALFFSEDVASVVLWLAAAGLNYLQSSQFRTFQIFSHWLAWFTVFSIRFLLHFLIMTAGKRRQAQRKALSDLSRLSTKVHKKNNSLLIKGKNWRDWTWMSGKGHNKGKKVPTALIGHLKSWWTGVIRSQEKPKTWLDVKHREKF